MISLHDTSVIRPDVNVSEVEDIDLNVLFGEYKETLKFKFIRSDNSINTKAIFENSVYKSCIGFEDKLERYFGKEYFREVVYCLLKDIQFIPRCPICHNLNYLRDWVKGFQEFCCRNCINRHQKTVEWKNKVIKQATEATVIKNSNNKYFEQLGIKKYRKDPNNPNFYIIDNYCKHSSYLKIGYTRLVNYCKQGRATLCKECNEEIYNTYSPTLEDIKKFKEEFREFIKNKNGLTTEAWMFYYPKELKLIDFCCEYYGTYDRNSSIVDKLNLLSNKFLESSYAVKEKKKLAEPIFYTMEEIYKASSGDTKTVMSYLRKMNNFQILLNETLNISNNVSCEERYYCWLHKLSTIPKCPHCGRLLKWIDMSKGFDVTCKCQEYSKKKETLEYKNMTELWEAANKDARAIMTYLRQERYLKLLISETHTLPDDLSKSNRFYCWLYKITEIPKCPYCGKDRMFCDFNKGYFPTCGDKECSRKSRIDNNKKTAQTTDYSERVEKMKNTYYERTGYYHNMQNPEFKEKFFENYEKTHNGEKCGVCSQKAIENRKKTFDEKYGGDIRKALVDSAIKKYGSLSEMASIAQTNRYANAEPKIEIVIPSDELLDMYLESYFNNEMSNRSLIMTIKNNQGFIDEVIKRTPFLDEYNPDDIVERIYYLANDLTEIVRCKYCDNKATWKYRGIRGGYYEICFNPECYSKKLEIIHTGMTNVSEKRLEDFKKWQENVTELNDTEILLHIRFDKLIPYIDNPRILEYLDNRFKDSDSYEETLARIELDIEEKPKCALPGCNNPVKWIGRQRALFTKHCCLIHSNQDPITKEKCIQTNIEHWGTASPYNSPIYQQKVFEQYGVYYHSNRPDILEKIENTRRALGTSGTSHEEQELCRIMTEELGYEIKTQYRSDVYPYCCDIYIPKWNLYIEYQGSQYHMSRPFEGTLEDMMIIEELHQKDIKRQEEMGMEYSTQYAAIIRVWSVVDPKKRQHVKKFNLNFLEIFKYKNADDVRQQIEKYLESRNIKY